jgi:hypothetical protein
MQWKCPHCQVDLFVPDEKLGSGWSFSKCYQCTEYSLVRKLENGIIKINQKAKNSSHVASVQNEPTPSEVMSSYETVVRQLKFPPIPKEIRRADRPSNTNHSKVAPVPSIPVSTTKLNFEPLPEPNKLTNKIPLLQFPKMSLFVLFAVVGSASIAVYSGFKLYNQIQIAWNKTQKSISMREALDSTPVIEPISIREVTKSLPPQVVVTPPKQKDEIQISRAAAETVVKKEDIVVQPKMGNVTLRSGPGTKYPKVGIAESDKKYLVRDWKEQWFQVELKDPTLDSQKDTAKSPKTMWVRNDLVEVSR